MLKAYKYRIYPTNEQKVLLSKHFGSCRWLYNYALDKKKTAYEKDKTNISRFDLQKELPLLKRSEETSWLSEINAQSLQAVLLHLDKAYKTFFKQKKGYPKFKKRSGHQSFECSGNKREIDWEQSFITIPKIKNITIVLSRRFDGKIKTVTISKTPTNKYFASVLVECETVIPSKKTISPETTIGIDLGIKDYLTFDSGLKEPNPTNLRNDLDRLKILSRRASKKKKGSKNRIKQNYRLAILHEKISNKRLDFLHKLSRKIVNENQVDTICIESLQVSNMIKNHKLALSISDAGWGKFIELLKYKCDWSGKNLIKIGKFEPSSKTCNSCGYIHKTLELKDRIWQCSNCLVTHDRDINAAKNIKIMGLKITGEALSVEPAELRTLVRTMKQENTVL